MERVGAFISKLQEQYQQHADNVTLLVTVQMLLAELQHNAQINHKAQKVSVVMPHVQTMAVSPEPLPEEQPVPPTPEIEQPAAPDIQPETQEPAEIPTQTPSEMPQEQPDEVPPVAEPSTTIYGLRPTNPAFFMQEEAPTLAQQQDKKEVYELNASGYGEEVSLNDKLKANNAPELASKLQDEPIRDLRKAININDRYQFISELFRGDETMYERSIKTINSFTVYQEANYWIQREMIYKLGWDDNNPVVKHFNQLVKRRFS